jgi:PAS domain S-box-containing protein
MKTKKTNSGSAVEMDPGVYDRPGLFRSMVEGMTDGALILDNSCRITYANKSICRLTGFSKDELAGKEVIDIVDPSEQAIVKSIFPVDGNKKNDPIKTTLRTKTGAKIIVVLSGNPYLNNDNGIEGHCLFFKDISKEEMLDAALKESKDEYRLLIENHGEGMGGVDKNKIFIMSNPVADQIFGVAPGGLVTRNLMDFIVPEQYSKILEESKKRTQRERSTYEVDIITASGEVKNLLVTATPQVNKEGKQTGAFAVFRDITQLKKIQENLRQGELRYRTLFESAPDAILLLHKDKFVDCNPAALQLFGCEKHEIIGKAPDAFSPVNQPDGQDSIRKTKEKLKNAFLGDSRPFEWKHKKCNGTEFDAEVILCRLEVDSKQMTLAFVRDITERKRVEEELRQSEQKYRHMTNLLPTTIFESDLNGNLIYANQTGMDWFGFTEKEIEKGVPVLRFIAPQQRQRAADTISVILTQNITSSGEYLAQKKNGELFNVYITSSPVLKNGKPVGVRGNITDITKIKEAEETSLKLASIVESSDDAIIGKTLDGIITSWNKGAENVFGYSASEIIGNSALILINEQNQEEEKIFLEKIKNGEHIKHYETKRRRKDGSEFEVSLTISPIRNLTGEVTGAASIIHDITERRNAEKFRLAKETTEALLKSEEKFSKAFHNSPVPMCITTLNKPQFIEVNRSFEEQIGFTNEELKDRFLSDVSITYEIINTEEIIQSLTKKGLIRNQEITIHIKNGDKRICLLSSEIFEIGGEPCALNVLLDITERRLAEQTLAESQQRFQLMVEQTLVGFIECDTNFLITAWNPSAERIFGFTAKEVIGRHVGNLIVKEEDQSDRNKLWRDILASRGGISTTNENLTKDGRVITCEWHDTAIIDRKGCVIGIVSLVADISERIEIENSLRTSREQLQHFAQHLQTVREEERVYISRELHDSLGQSLTGLKMYAFNISNKLNAELSGKNLDAVRDQAKEVIVIIDGIMQQVRKIAKELRPRILDEFGLIPAIESHIEEITRLTNIDYEFIKMIQTIEMDPAHSMQVFRIFQEACTNIIRHANATMITVRVNLKGNRYFIEVEDNGCGIRETDISKLKSLGLLGMKERSQVFGGDLEITGVEGKGTKVVLSFPKENK